MTPNPLPVKPVKLPWWAILFQLSPIILQLVGEIIFRNSPLPLGVGAAEPLSLVPESESPLREIHTFGPGPVE